MPMPPKVAYIAQGKIKIAGGAGEARDVESRFAEQVRERARSMERRHGWKQHGRGANFTGGAQLWGADSDPGAIPIAVTGVARGRAPGELLYSLTTDAVGGVFAVAESGDEQRIYHGTDHRIFHLAASPEHEAFACSTRNKNGTSNIALMRADGSQVALVTDGDTIDLAPRWIPSAPRTLVFQSAGIGRDPARRMVGLGPFTIQILDVEQGALETIISEPEMDCIAPQMLADGTVYYIRRPYAGVVKPPSPFRMLLDLVLFPFRLLFAVAQYLNFFSARYTGKPLITSGSARQREADARRMLEMGNLQDAAHAAARGVEKDDAATARVPSTWQLVRRKPKGEPEVVAKSVAAFDLCPDGGVVFSDGGAVHWLDAEGKKHRIAEEKFVEQLAVLG
jgi:hypothetical protein